MAGPENLKIRDLPITVVGPESSHDVLVDKGAESGHIPFGDSGKERGFKFPVPWQPGVGKDFISQQILGSEDQSLLRSRHTTKIGADGCENLTSGGDDQTQFGFESDDKCQEPAVLFWNVHSNIEPLSPNKKETRHFIFYLNLN